MDRWIEKTKTLWRGRPRAHTPRRTPTSAVLLGMALGVCGMFATFSATASAQTGVWTPTGSMHTTRQSHTATLLANGKVLVAGGNAVNSVYGNGPATASTELYDPDTGVWTATGSMHTPRIAHMAILLTTGPSAGMVLVAGGSSVCRGCTPILDSAELYDPSTGLWSVTDSMTTARYWDFPAPAQLPDGSVLVVGGIACCYHWFNEAELFDPVSQTWTPTSTKTTTANEGTALLPDGQLLVVGGVKGMRPTERTVATAELFNAETDTWKRTARMSIARQGHTTTVLASGQVLVAGGYDKMWWESNCLSSAELYNPHSGKWLLTGLMTAARAAHTATLLPNGQVLVAGGQGMSSKGLILSSAELYTPPSVGGMVTGLRLKHVVCRNLTTGQNFMIDLHKATSWDCEAAGLVVNPGDRIKQTLTGIAD